jgi:carboxymethylenebutenolidase
MSEQMSTKTGQDSHTLQCFSTTIPVFSAQKHAVEILHPTPHHCYLTTREEGKGEMTTRNLVALWEEHCRCEFEKRDANATMATMIPQPYVNHIPTMTGGVGYDQLKRFYAHHFIPVNPPDFRLTPVSRTIGSDTIVDEFIVHFTHTTVIDWLLPGVPPTGRAVAIPTVAIVKFEGDKLAHEHIYWDQASVLVQVGMLDPRGLPVAGAETAHKVTDTSLPSNRLMERWRGSNGKSA